MRFDLVIKNGRLVIPDVGIVHADVGIEDGKIGALGTNLDGREEIDVCNNHILPGIIDPHIHLGIFGDLATEMETETRSAILGGVTTVGCFMGGPGGYWPAFADTLALADNKAAADIFFHLSIMTPEQQKEIPVYIERLGITSFKLYMSGIPGLIPDVDDYFLLKTFELLAGLGPQTLACVHAENPQLVNGATAELRARLADGTLGDWSASHPNIAEEEAVRRASYLAGVAGNRLYLVHMSTKESMASLPGIKAQNPRIYAETTSPYLSVSKDSAKGLVAKMVPPFREEASVEALWQAVEQGVIDTIGTDNVTLTLAQKQAEKGMWEALPGYPAVGTHLPAVLHYGVNRRGLDLLRVARLMSQNPARIYGLYPQKGVIAPGSDADLVVVDLNREVLVNADLLGSRGDFSLYDGEILRGWPVMTFKSGRLVAREGQIVGEARGRFLRRHC